VESQALNKHIILLTIGLAVLLPACQKAQEAAVEDSAPGKSSLAGLASQDLSEHLGIPVADIEVLREEAVTWRDGSLGCPKPDMMYTQALIEGSSILLRANGRDYAYHSGKGRPPFYCENPVSPASGPSAE
jgi:hypothetical protein